MTDAETAGEPPNVMYFLVGEPVAWIHNTVTWEYDLRDLRDTEPEVE